MSGIRVRIAPSPTGEPHIGTAYTAIFNALLAEKHGGDMVLRIEDTDQARSTQEAEDKLLEALQWLGLNWSEGPDKGGDYGPYRQSERAEIYRPYVDQLIDGGHAFHCFCTKERLDEMREAQRAAGEPVKYDGRCAALSDDETAGNIKDGVPSVVRMRVPEDGNCEFADGVFGDVSIPYGSIDMQVLLKADGLPTYHLANVVDDHLMKITHVARGEEWMSSMPKHLLLYQYFGWTPPAFMHLPLMRNPDRTKLSKRRNPTSLSYFSAIGCLPETLTNFLGNFFIKIAEGEELMDWSEMLSQFDETQLTKAGAVFDMQKLVWLNGRWIREKLDAESFRTRVSDWAVSNGMLRETLELARSRANLLGDLPDLAGFVFKADVGVSAASFDGLKKITPADCRDIIKAARAMTDTLPEWTAEAIEAGLRQLADELDRKFRLVLPPLFIAVSGSRQSLPLFSSMALLGRAVVRQRLADAANVLKDVKDEPAAS